MVKKIKIINCTFGNLNVRKFPDKKEEGMRVWQSGGEWFVKIDGKRLTSSFPTEGAARAAIKIENARQIKAARIATQKEAADAKG